jgi:uncharacterized protein (TIGR02301 family)
MRLLAAGLALAFATSASAAPAPPAHHSAQAGPHVAQRPQQAAPSAGGKPQNGTAAPEAGTSGPTSEERPLYEAQMLRLAEVLGALSFLRSLCGANDAPLWQQKMRALIDAEAVTQEDRERLAGAYNRGFNGYALTYRRCNDSAEMAIARFLAEGERLATTISSRYGG